MLHLRVLLCVVTLASAPSLSAAPDRILLLRLAPTHADLFISNADGSGEHSLAHSNSLDYNPSWSPGGDWIVFTSERSGSADLYRIHPDGSGLERLTDNPAYDDQAAFSPDGKQIVFVSTRDNGTANLWTLDTTTRKTSPLTSGRGGDFRPSWSPDGKWIAFSSDRGSTLPPAKGRWERLHIVDIYLIHPDGTGLKRISAHGDFCGNPKWTRDSQNIIAYCMSAQDTWTYRTAQGDGDTNLAQINIATGTTTPVALGPGVKLYPAVLPSGEIAYLRHSKTSPQGVFYASGKQGPTGADINSPSWSPDGVRVVYSRYATTRVPDPQKLWSRNPNFEISTTTFLPAYAPTGDRFAATTINKDMTSSLVIVEEGKPTRSIFDRKELMLAPQWSPDGKQIVFGIGGFSAFLDFAIGGKKPVDPVNGGAQVALINTDGTGFHLITSGPNNNAFAGFSPDGKHLVYRTAGPDGEGLRLMNLEDHATTTLTTDYDNFPVWSPRNDLIAFIRKIDGNFEVFTIHPDGKDLKQLTNTPGNEAHLAWSPDGERLAFASTRMGFKDEALYTGNPQPYGEIFVMRFDGTQLEQLTDDQWEEGGPAWQPHKTPSAAAPAHSK
jgi:TolB protein